VSRTHCRCRKCDKRVALDQPPEWYDRPPVCPRCDGPLRVDKWANSRPWRAYTCRCSSYPYPHNRSRGECWFPRVGQPAWDLMPSMVDDPLLD
jgi:hypothetical protein